jgi:hypothetical protein
MFAVEQLKGVSDMKEYNGWTNWETWNFKLWMDNDESSYEFVKDLAEGKDTYELSGLLESYADEMLRVWNLRGFYADVCNSSIKEINFYEIAESYLSDRQDIKTTNPIPNKGE